MNIKQIYDKRYKEKYPWMKSYSEAKQRCTNPNHNRYRWYGEKGIKFLLTKEKVKKLWFRDKAYNMKKPSIDRIDNDGHYEYDNCRFIEKSLNSKLATSKPIFQLDLNGNILKKFNSTVEASKLINISHTAINNCLKKLSKTSGGFKWEYV